MKDRYADLIDLKSVVEGSLLLGARLEGTLLRVRLRHPFSLGRGCDETSAPLADLLDIRELPYVTDREEISVAFHLGWSAMDDAKGDPKAEARAVKDLLSALGSVGLGAIPDGPAAGGLLYNARTPEGIDAALEALLDPRRPRHMEGLPPVAMLAELLRLIPESLMDDPRKPFRLDRAEIARRQLGILEGILRRKDLEVLAAADLSGYYEREAHGPLRPTAGAVLGSYGVDRCVVNANDPGLDEETVERVRAAALAFLDATKGGSLEFARGLCETYDEGFPALDLAGLDPELVCGRELYARRQAARALADARDPDGSPDPVL
jgi:hypothetical protein